MYLNESTMSWGEGTTKKIKTCLASFGENGPYNIEGRGQLERTK